MKTTLFPDKSSLFSSRAFARFAIVFAVTAVAGFLAACSPPDSERRPDDSSTGYILTVPTSDADKVAAAASITCGASDCPSGIAMITSRFDRKNETRFKVCTAFLVAPGVLATNTHCLPDDLRSDMSNCRGRIKAHFASSYGRSAETVDCESVLSASNINEDPKSKNFTRLPDFALIRLRGATARTPIEISRLGLSDRLALTVFSVEPDLSAQKISGRIEQKTCVTNQFTAAMPSYTNDFAPVASATCSIHPGNSGSPALDSQGHVRAIVHATKVQNRATRDSFTNVSLPPAFNDIGLLTNMACADTGNYVPSFGWISNQCSAKLKNQTELMTETLQTTSINASVQFSQWPPPSTFGFELRTVTSNGQTNGYAYLKCVVPFNRLDLQTPSNIDGVSVKGSVASVQYKTPYWGNQIALDADYRISATIAMLADRATTVTFDVDSLRANGVTRARKTETLESGKMLDSGEFDLLACP